MLIEKVSVYGVFQRMSWIWNMCGGTCHFGPSLQIFYYLFSTNLTSNVLLFFFWKHVYCPVSLIFRCEIWPSPSVYSDWPRSTCSYHVVEQRSLNLRQNQVDDIVCAHTCLISMQKVNLNLIDFVRPGGEQNQKGICNAKFGI